MCIRDIIFFTSLFNAGAFNFDTGHIRPYTDNEISLGEGNARFVNCHLINNPSVTSDERMKDNIKTSSLGLDFLNQLNPVQYKWKDYETYKKAPPESEKEFTDEKIKHTYKRTHYGLIAQEVEKVLTDNINVSSIIDANVDINVCGQRNHK